MGTKTKFRFNRFSAVPANDCFSLDFLPLPEGARFLESISTPVTLQKKAPFLNGKKGNKKEGQIMVNPFQAGLLKAAGRAHSLLFVNRHGFGLNTGYEKKHGGFHSRKELCSIGTMKKKAAGVRKRKNIDLLDYIQKNR